MTPTLSLLPNASTPPESGRGPEGTLASLPPRARLLVIGIIVVGAAAVGHACLLSRVDRPFLFLSLLVLSSLTSTVKLPLPLKHGASSLSVSYAIDVLALLTCGRYEATLVTTASAWSQCTFRMQRRNPLHRTLFSMATLAVSMQAAGLAYQALRGNHQDVAYGLIQPLGGAALAYYLLNTSLVAAAIALSTRQRLLKVWQENFMWSAPSYFIGAACAAVAKLAVEQGTSYWLLGLILVPAYLTYRSYRMFIDRIEREQAGVRQASGVQMATIEALALAIEAKDRTSQTQIRRMQAYAAGLARAVGMPEDDIPGLQTAALLHDIGNLAIPEHILSTPGPLTYEEFQKVKTHPRVGAEILKHVPFPYPVASLILAHHEHWDGNGYPAGLEGENIPLGARVLAVVDSYSSLSADRPHRPARPYHEVLVALRQAAGSLLDPSLVDTFISILPVLEFQFASEGRQARQPLLPATASATPHLPGGVLEDIAVAHHEVRALYQIAQALGSSLGITERMSLIERSLGELVPFSCFALYLQSEEGGPFECRWASGTADHRVRQLSVSTLAEIETTLVTINRGNEGDPLLQSLLVAPLVFNGSVIGALTIYHTDARFYSPDHRRVFLCVAEQAAPVIRNSIVFERTQAESFTDQLTKLPNRRYMLLYLSQQMARAERRRSKLAVVMMDLNDFKEVNDQLGHQTGDRALHELASVLRSMVRAYDLCVRYGGDEFVVILWECDAEQAERRRRDIEQAVEAMYFEARPGEARALSVSAGVAVFPEDGHTHEELLAVADRRMYQQKAEAKKRREGHAAVTARA